MTRSSTFILGALAAVAMAACNPPRNDTTTGGTGAESGSTTGGMSGSADSTATGAGTMSDTGRAGLDTTAK